MRCLTGLRPSELSHAMEDSVIETIAYRRVENRFFEKVGVWC